MDNQVQQHLSDAAILTFEQLGFMIPLPEAGSSGDSADFSAAARVRFSGPFHGSVTVAAYGELLPMLAANMLGEDEPPSAVQQRDALGEVTNVICGNLLPMMAGTEAVFRLGAPEAIEPTRLDDGPSEARSFVVLDGGQADVRLRLD